MEFIHIADLHANKARVEPCLKVLDTLYNFISEKETKPILLIAGDFWDSVMQNTEASGFTKITAKLNKLITITKVIFISGTPNHEPEGSLKIFEELGATVFYNSEIADFGDFEIIAIPEPRRSNFQCSTVDEQSAQINSYLDSFLSSIPKKTKPRILMYHGEVKGSVYQNGSNASSPIALDKKQLQQTNSDYYALGHIHLPQQLWENCWYVGSCYPKDAGEHHTAGFNHITIEDGKTTVERIFFGFAENVTEYVAYENIDSIKKKNYKNKNLTLKISLDKLLKKSFDRSTLEQEIKDATHAESVRLLFEYKENTNIRSDELVAQKSLVDKFKIYCDINDIKHSEKTLLKVQQIQDGLISESFIPCDTFELEYLSLRGAIGIKDGLGLDEYNIDFTKYKNGVLALTAPNGAGKTTLLENCHPFPKMLTRTGALPEHFCLTDSHRILVYKTSSGKRIRIKMMINGVHHEPPRYYVEMKDPDGEFWYPYKSVDGTLPSYKAWVETTFGTYQMFLRTSFYANKNIKELPDLSIATKGEKMALFSTLAGIEYLSTISDIAKEKAKEADDELKELKKDVANFDEIKERLFRAQQTIEENTVFIAEEQKLLEKDEEQLRELETKQNEFLAAVGSAGIIRRTLVEKNSDLRETEKRIDTVKETLEEVDATLANKDFYMKQIAWWQTSIEQEDQFRREKEELNSALTALATEKTNLQTKEMAEKDKLSQINTKVIEMDGELKLVRKGLHKINDICPVCGEKLSEEKKTQLLKENEEIEKQAAVLQKQVEDLSEQKVPIEQEILKIREVLDQNQKDSVEVSAKISDINLNLSQINQYRVTVDIDKAKYVVEELQPEADKLAKELQELFVKRDKLEESIKELEEQEKNIPEDFSLKIQKIKDASTDSRDKIAVWISEINISKQVVEDLTEKSKAVVAVSDKVKALESDYKDYTIIQKAFSYTGIQSLELDSAAPEISAIANDILYKSYGDRFSIAFETQRDSKDGRKIDDFVIMVFDAKSGRRKELDMLSTGESIWIKQALYFAFSVIRSKRSGFCFKTRFIDESDGALDSEARIKYLKMLESAHASCGANLTLMVTHSQEIKDIVSQRIDLF